MFETFQTCFCHVYLFINVVIIIIVVVVVVFILPVVVAVGNVHYQLLKIHIIHHDPKPIYSGSKGTLRMEV